MLYKLWKPHCHFTELSLKFMKKASVQQLPTKKRLYTKFIKARRDDMTSCWLPTVRFLNTLPSHFSRPKNCDTRFHKVFVRSRNLVSFCLKNFLSVLFVSVSKSLISSKSWTCSYRVINVSGKSIFTTVWKYLGIIVDIIQETNVKERILTVKENSNVVNNTLQESEYSDWNHMVDRSWSCLGFGFYCLIRNFSYSWLLV